MTVGAEDSFAHYRIHRNGPAVRQRQAFVSSTQPAGAEDCFFHRLALPEMRPRHQAADARALFSFNNPVGACPKCRGFGRTIGIDLDRALPDKRLSIARGVVKPFQSGQSAECQRDLTASRRPAGDRCERPVRGFAQGRSEIRYPGRGWWTCRCRRTLLRAAGGTESKVTSSGSRSKTYKMHVRVLLSRYRAYTLCPGVRRRTFPARDA